MTGVSIRALHHYDQIGLLRPAETAESGYRLYSEDDLARLQEILFFKELDFSLAEIRAIMASPAYKRDEALAAQKDLLGLKIKRLRRLIGTIDKTIEHDERGMKMEDNEMFNGLDDVTMGEYKREAKEKWGETDAYKESARKTAAYTKADWERIGAESSDIYVKIADLMDAGRTADDADVQAQVQRWRDHITGNFYRCGPEMVRGLGEMYVADARFTKNIDKVRPGLAAFLSKAMVYYADNCAE
jgi:DNA-binding transcriptional MerR regulator